MTQKEAAQELHDQVRQCLTRHKFKTFGDIMEWWHQAPYEERVAEAGTQGISKFSTDLMWIIGIFGPQEKIDRKRLGARKAPKLPHLKVDEDPSLPTITQTKPSRPIQKKTRRRRI